MQSMVTMISVRTYHIISLESSYLHVTYSRLYWLDFGVEHLICLAREMNFPWLMSNVKSAKTGSFLADGKEKHIIVWQGRKVRCTLNLVSVFLILCVQIGLIGLVELEWIDTLAALEPNDVIYTDFVKSAKELVPKLQQEVETHIVLYSVETCMLY